MSEGIQNAPRDPTVLQQSQLQGLEATEESSKLRGLIQDKVETSQTQKEQVQVGDASRPILAEPADEAPIPQELPEPPPFAPDPKNPKNLLRQITQFPNSKLAKAYEEDFSTVIEELVKELSDSELNKFPGSTRKEKEENLKKLLKEGYKGGEIPDGIKSALEPHLDRALSSSHTNMLEKRHETYAQVAQDEKTLRQDLDKALQALTDEDLAEVPGGSRDEKIGFLKEHVLQKYYMGEDSLPELPETLSSLINGVYLSSVSSLDPSLGIKGIEMYVARVNGMYMGEIEGIMRGAGLDIEEMRILFNELTKPLDPSDPVSVRAYEIKEQALIKVGQKFGVPSTFKPDAITQDSIQKFTSIGNPELAKLNGLSDMVNTIREQILNTLPDDDPMKEVYLNFLEQISKALQEAKELMYELEVRDSEMSIALAEVKRELVNDRMQELSDSMKVASAKREEIARKRRKARKKRKSPLKKFMKALTYVAFAVSLVVAIYSGPVGIALFLAIAVMSNEGPIGDLKSAMGIEFEGAALLDKAVDEVFSVVKLGEVRQAIKIAIKVAIIAAVIIACLKGNVGMLLGPTLAMEATMNSGAIDNIVVLGYMCSGAHSNIKDPIEREKAILADEKAQLVLTCVKAAVTIIFIAAQLGTGIGVQHMIKKAIKEGGSKAAWAADLIKAQNKIERIVATTGAAASMAATSAGISNSLREFEAAKIDAGILKLRAELAALEGENSAVVELIQQFIELLEQLLAKLMDSTSSFPEEAANINNLLTSMYEGLSEGQSQLYAG